jgi:hypothetical protein
MLALITWKPVGVTGLINLHDVIQVLQNHTIVGHFFVLSTSFLVVLADVNLTASRARSSWLFSLSSIQNVPDAEETCFFVA